jgi:hypothetical protein
MKALIMNKQKNALSSFADCWAVKKKQIKQCSTSTILLRINYRKPV